MANTDLASVYSGLVLRALICKRCKKVLPVAIDDIESMKRVKAIHVKAQYRGDPPTHLATYGDAALAIWHVNNDGRISVPFSDNLILRVGSTTAPDTQHDAEGGDAEGGDA